MDRKDVDGRLKAAEAQIILLKAEKKTLTQTFLDTVVSLKADFQKKYRERDNDVHKIKNSCTKLIDQHVESKNRVLDKFRNLITKSNEKKRAL